VADGPTLEVSAMETAWGYPIGHAPGPLPPSRLRDPRDALEDVVLDALRRPPCGVAFSGGRDSSAILATATHVARRESLPDPVPITLVFPDVVESQEGEWQELVVRHLGLDSWERLSIHDELDLVGPLATRHLVEHGVLWPPTVHSDLPVMRLLAGGTLLDGEGGDEVLGIGAHRIAPITGLVRTSGLRRFRHVDLAARALAPGALRERRVRSDAASLRWPWLRPIALEALADALVRAERERPLSFSASVRRVPLRRTQLLLARSRRLLGHRDDVRVVSPLLHHAVVRALARDGGVLGRGDRTTVLRALVPDLLPDAVLARTSKATFTGVYHARHTREFGERWTGAGIDPELVDVEQLRQIWRASRGASLTAGLLQHAWLADRRAGAP
jgi:asparagine synthetase B (glutamine-hydrolysing)